MNEPENEVAESDEKVNSPIPRIDITGKEFGTLTALEFVRTSDWNTGWKCVCRCGVIRVINGWFLRSGKTTHCGCLDGNQYQTLTDSHEKRGPAFFCYCGMMTRCFNPNCKKFGDYGGVGITVCERWHNRTVFCEDMGDRPSRKHSLHRVDNDANYSCGKCDECIIKGWDRNVVWALPSVQARTRSSNHLLAYGGETLCMMDMAEKHRVSYFALRNRIRHGWTTEDAIETPIEPDHAIEYKGKIYTQKGLAKACKINLSTLRSRLRKGCSVEAAVEHPLIPRGSQKGKGVLVITQMPNETAPLRVG